MDYVPVLHYFAVFEAKKVRDCCPAVCGGGYYAAVGYDEVAFSYDAFDF